MPPRFDPYDDDRIIVHLTVWENAAAPREFVYRGDHAAIMKKRVPPGP